MALRYIFLKEKFIRQYLKKGPNLIPSLGGVSCCHEECCLIDKRIQDIAETSIEFC